MKNLLCLIVPYLLSSCAYLQSVSQQSEFLQNQETNPRQHTLKHIIERQTYFVYGRLHNGMSSANQHTLAVVALCNKYQNNEIVDANYLGKVDSYYGLNLPEGAYRLLVLEDENDDRNYSETEIIAQYNLTLDAQTYPDKVVGGVDIQLHTPITPLTQPLNIPAPKAQISRRSLFYPKGTIRALGDPIFSAQMATLGMYDPAAFMENAPMLFYAMEEDTMHKVPVVFVHGIGGRVKEFHAILDRLDRERYKPWFFYYPSGMDLNQLAKIFYDIYLSGEVIPKGGSGMVIVAHSMGGLVVREALNLYQGNDQESVIKLFISMASPFGGLSSAQTGVERAPLVLPAWRDLTPQGAFIKNLFRIPLRSSVEHHLIYAYRKSGDARDSDGVVPVHSQLRVPAPDIPSKQYGFQSGHAELLRDPAAIDTVINLITRVKSHFPEEHLYYLSKGGFDIVLNGSYSDLERRVIKSMGIYLRALVNSELEPIPLNEPFLAVVRGNAEPANYFDTAWLKFRKDYPKLATSHID